MPRSLAAFCCLLLASLSRADGPRDNNPETVRPVPPPGIAVTRTDFVLLTDEAANLGKEIASLKVRFKKNPAALELIPDIEIFHNAVHYALKYNEFYKPGELDIAAKLLTQGRKRAQELKDGKPSWIHATGLVVRGYVSRIDGSVQPYGLVVPASFRSGSAHRHRLDIWFHGRGETLSELSFIDGRQKSPGQFTPPDAFVLHPYGRYCNANHFAGEVDTFEAMEHVQKHYKIDDNRIVVRGFSMGGAACWHFAVHHAWRWAAAAPGAGFSETPDFLKVFQKETLNPLWHQDKLWSWYDCNRWAMNLYHCPTVAYSGEKDSQKQAADIMEAALAAEGMKLVHIIGPKMGHSYHPDSKREIDHRIDAVVERGREVMPKKIRFVTWTLRYPRMHWVHVEGLAEHWKEARLIAEIIAPSGVLVETKNVTALTLRMEPGLCPLDATKPVRIVIDGEEVPGGPVLSDRSWVTHLRKIDSHWRAIAEDDDQENRKRPGLQGPIDDAFMDKFVMVRPTRTPWNEATGKWGEAEMAHAVDHWRKQFRGEITPKKDVDVSDADIASSNLILWGDPGSNAILAKIADKLPIVWTKASIQLKGKTLGSEHHVPVLIAPNPLNPKKYVVLNSGFTFREYDYLNNARQVPRLPDWAILDIRQPATSQTPAGIIAADFFDEQWRLK